MAATVLNRQESSNLSDVTVFNDSDLTVFNENDLTAIFNESDDVDDVTVFNRQDSSKHSDVTVFNCQDSSNHINVTLLNRNDFPLHSDLAVNFYGSLITVTVTASASMVNDWINTTLSLGEKHLRRSSLYIGMSMDPGGNTLHLCVGSRCLIFQLNQADDIPPSLRKFFLNYECKFAGFWNKWHRKMLADSKHRLLMHRGSFNLRWLNPSLRNELTEEMVHKGLGFKVELKEEIRSSDWSGPLLTDDQVVYACVEAYCAFIYARNFKLSDIVF